MRALDPFFPYCGKPKPMPNPPVTPPPAYLDTDDERAKLEDPKAPHETSGVVRIFNAGYNGKQLGDMLGRSPEGLQAEFKRGLSQREDAARRGVRICEGRAKRDAK